MLVMISTTPEGRKELLGFQVGVRESAQSWHELLVDLKARGLRIAPELAVADGALGFWKALDEVFPGTRHQRCWFHKTGNVLNKVAKSIQPAVKQDLREIWMAPDRKAAERAFDVFEKKYGAKYSGAVECLTKDRDALLAFYNFPAEHWDHVRTLRDPLIFYFWMPLNDLFDDIDHQMSAYRLLQPSESCRAPQP
jgi:putative transposase